MLSFIEFDIVFKFSPATLAFDVEANLQVYAVDRPVSVLASFIVFLIHLAIVSLDTGLNGLVNEIKSAGSDDLVNLTSRQFNMFFNGHKSGHSGCALNIKGFLTTFRSRVF